MNGGRAARVIAVAFAVIGTLRCDRANRAQAAADAPPAHVAVLLEDNAESLLPLLTNPTGDPGEGHVEQAEVFTGGSAVRIVPMQRFHPQIPGWNFGIREKPRKGEYRYVRWAWKADGCVGTMVQFHIATGWSIRYCAGQNDPGWGSKFVSDKPPTRWVVVTRDLFADFGECAITGIAMTAFQGQAGYFDHVYFGRTVDDLDRVDATGLRKAGAPEVRLTPDVLERTWEELSSADAKKAYRAFWTLRADPERSTPFLKEKLANHRAGADVERLRRWVLELGHDDPGVRETASERLADHADAAAELLTRELEADLAPEVRVRIELLLKRRGGAASRPDRVAQAVRVLEYAGARAALKELSERADVAPETAAAAKAALGRLAPTAP